MIELDIAQMMESGAHFGHQTKRWNPKMRPYLYGSRSGVHIINLQKTKSMAGDALEFITNAVSQGKEVLFVGTKPQARDIIKTQAERCHMHYVNNRWMGGTLTNFKTIKNSIDRLIDLSTKRENNDFEGYTKKELLDIDRLIGKLEASLGGIKKLKKQPDVVFVVDPHHEGIAVRESNRLHIPVIAMVDSNCDPDPVDYLIPANDDAIASIEYFAAKVADACLLGLEKRQQNIQYEEAQSAAKSAKKEDKKPARRVTKTDDAKGKKAKGAYVAKHADKETFEGEAQEGFSAKVEEEKPLEKRIIEEEKNAS